MSINPKELFTFFFLLLFWGGGGGGLGGGGGFIEHGDYLKNFYKLGELNRGGLI